ncbi:RidA family protein [Nocardioides bigeumensis]|uniref:RidA family protein n=1 Tax=Nocardioides bigeumensis TaxID=433657 RepID=A0ABN2XJS8_9ACTN
MIDPAEVLRRLEGRGLTWPAAPVPPGHYVAAFVHGDVAETAGHLPFTGDVVAVTGRLGDGIDLAAAVRAAEIATVNALSSLADTIGGLERIVRIVRLRGYVVATPDFGQHHLVTNGASDLLGDLFGDAGAGHVRASVGITSLPFDAPVEIELSAVIRP